jgi:hypothetical protein
MASSRHYRGEAAVHAFVSRLLLRGHNPGRPLFDEGAADDLYVSVRGRKAVVRVQVKSRKIEWHTGRDISKSITVSIPDEIVDEESSLDLVVVCFWDEERWLIGLFDGSDIRRLLTSGVGCRVSRKHPHGPEIHFRTIIDLRAQRRLTFSGMDVSRHFLEKEGKWDELFPSRFDS